MKFDTLINSNHKIYEHFMKSAANIITYYQNDERDDMLSELRKEIETLCALEEKVNTLSATIPTLSSQADDRETENEEDWKKKYDELKNALSVDPDISQNENWKEFNRVVSALEAAAANKNSTDNDDAELQFTQNTVNVIDPFTKRRMIDPVRNIICSHVYDRESVTEVLKINPQTRCPMPGCKYNDFLSMRILKPDIITKNYLDENPA